MTSRSLDPAFIEGFVKTCMDHGLTMDQTEAAFRQHSFNYLLSTPDIHRGFTAKIANYKGDLTKAQMADYLSPHALAITAECQIKYGSDPLSEGIRFELGLPEPSWETVDPGIRKIASALNNSMAYYAQLPMNQKVLLASLTGAGIGSLGRMVHPSVGDTVNDRNALHRALRGAGRGAMVGAGVGAGGEVGEIAGAEMNGAGGVIPGMVAGGAIGGLAANHLTR